MNPVIPQLDKKALKKLLFDLTKEVVIYAIKHKIMDEFVKRNLHNVYKEEIEAWFVYLDQQEFGKKLEQQMLEEIDRYMANKKTIEILINEKFPQPKIEWEKVFVEGITPNYFLKDMLGI